MAIQFPFKEVDEVAVAFGGIPNYDEVLAACPQEFWSSNTFSEIAHRWSAGTFDPARDLAGFALTAETTDEAIKQKRYVETWLGSFRPKDEDKIAVGGWLLSLMFTEVTQPDPLNS